MTQVIQLKASLLEKSQSLILNKSNIEGLNQKKINYTNGTKIKIIIIKRMKMKFKIKYK